MNLYNISPEDLAKNYNEFSLMVISDRMGTCANIMKHFSLASIQAIVNWEGERNTEVCTDYCNLIFNIMIWDSGSSSTQHETAQFVSDFIVALAKEKRKEIIRFKKKQMEESLKKAKKLRLELDAL